ncbi:MAG: alpha/beta hydrolase-fold protein [Eubacteriales bacterium]|nr:alpha/beta hydrolase-fold protein [Eubacteriales bacterium]
MITQELSFGEWHCTLSLPEAAPPYPIVYLPGSAEENGLLRSNLTERGAALALLHDVNWERDLSPWPAPRAFRGGADFSGGADAFLLELTTGLLPQAEELTGPPSFRVLAGYSLAGLFALYALYRTDAFERAASLSGSLWYDGLIEYLQTHKPCGTPQRVCFSLGDRERITRNPRLTAVETCTRAAQALLSATGAQTCLTFHPGNHFQQVPQRITQGILWTLGE